MPELEGLVAASRRPHAAAVEEAIFGSDSPAGIAARITAFVSEHVGTAEDALFYAPGVGVVAGMRLAGGARVVVKVHRYNASAGRLRAVQVVQGRAVDEGLPAPRPLLGPTDLGAGVAVVEEHLDGGPADGHLPEVRRSVAAALARFVRAAADLVEVADVGEATAVEPLSDTLWGEPHDLRFDFDATAAGAQWIDELARAARKRLCEPRPQVIGHFDWRVENLGFDGGDVVAIFDWDSLARAPEAVVVGQAAGGFSADWRWGPGTLPSVEEMAAFVTDYEAARGVPFDPAELDLLDAANLFLCAYGARCQHSDQTLWQLGHTRDHGWLRLLESRGERGLLRLLRAR